MCWSIPLIDTWSTLDQPLIDTRSTFPFTVVKSQLTLDWCMWLSWHLVHFLPTDQELTEYQLGCRLSVNQDFNWVSITGWLRVLIDIRPQMYLVNMIYFLSIYSVIASGESQKPIWIVKQCIQYVLFSLLLDIQNKDVTSSFKKIWPSHFVIN